MLQPFSISYANRRLLSGSARIYHGNPHQFLATHIPGLLSISPATSAKTRLKRRNFTTEANDSSKISHITFRDLSAAPFFAKDPSKFAGPRFIPEHRLYGTILAQHVSGLPEQPTSSELNIKTNEPFNALIFGEEDSGKGHSLNAVLDCCLWTDKKEREDPFSIAVFRFNQSGKDLQPSSAAYLAKRLPVTVIAIHAVMDTIRAAYAPIPHLNHARPLRFLQKDLTEELLAIFRLARRSSAVPVTTNTMMRREPINTYFRAGTCVVIDLSHPDLTAAQACVVFDHILALFKTAPNCSKKLLVLEDAHQFLTDDSSQFKDSFMLFARQKMTSGVLLTTMDPASVPDPFWKLSDFTITHKSPITSLSTLTKHLPSMAAAKRLHSEIPVFPAGEAILCAPKAIAGTFRRSNDQEASSITTLGNGYLRIRPRLLVENLPETYSPEDPLPDFSHIQPARTITLTGDLAQFIPLIKRMQRDTKVGHSNIKTLRKHFSRKDRTAYGAKTKALDSVFEAAIKMGVVIKEGTPPKSREKLLLIPRATYVFPASES